MPSPLRSTAVIAGLAGLLAAGHAAAHGGPPGAVGAPPVFAAPPVVVAPHAYPRHVWQPGYWAWTGYGHTWIEGRWVIAAGPRPTPYPYHRGWERRDWHRDPYGYGPHGGPRWGYR